MTSSGEYYVYYLWEKENERIRWGEIRREKTQKRIRREEQARKEKKAGK